MSKKKKSPKIPTPPTLPAAPTPQSEYFYDDNVLRSQRVYDSGRNGYITKSFSTPQERAIEQQGTSFINNLLGKLPSIFNGDPAQLEQYKESYAAPQRRALDESYNQAKGAAETAANSSGVRNSIGFNKYLSGQIEKNRAQGLADIAANAELTKYDLPGRALAPYTTAYNLASSALSGEQNRQQAQLEPAFQGSQAQNNFALQNYQSQLGALNGNYQNQLTYYNLKNQQPKSGGFLTKLFTGF